MAVEIAWLVVGVIWLVKYYHSCQAPTAKEALIGEPPPPPSDRANTEPGRGRAAWPLRRQKLPDNLISDR